MLNFGQVPNMFSNAREEELGIAYDERNITTAAVSVGTGADQYDVTGAFAEVTGMTVNHESKTGKVLVIYSCSAQTGAGEQVSVKLQKDGVDVGGTLNQVYVSKGDTSYWTIAGSGFFPSTSSYLWNTDTASGYRISDANSQTFTAPVELPHNAVVARCVVYGSSSAETWELIRHAIATKNSPAVMATAAANTEDTSIANATIDNTAYRYWIRLITINNGDEIYGARIRYTQNAFQHYSEGTQIPLTIHYVETNAGKNTWRIMAKTTQLTPDDSFINARILSVIDI